MTGTTAVVLSGGTFHDFEATSGALVHLLDGCGVRASVETDVDTALAGLDAGLLVVNCLRRNDIDSAESHVDLSGDAVAGLERHLAAGRPVLAVHTASISFDDVPAWTRALGGTWVQGRSGHPPIGTVRIDVRTDAHPVVAGLAGFDVHDEVYSWLDVAPDVVPLATSRHGEIDHPLVWIRELPGGSRLVHDALGHGPESYDVPAHQQLLRQAVGWLLS